jgi:RNA polymerase sigma-70 factor, ECF subfamily
VTGRKTTAEQHIDLIRRVSTGDPSAFRALVEHFRGPLYSFLLRMVRRPQIAEELVQETFVRAFRAAPRFKPTASVSTWLFHIAARLAMNEAARVHHRLEVMCEAPDVPATTLGPLEELETKELAGTIEKALSHLPAPQRAAVILARFEDMAYRDIGKVLGISEGAVEGLLQRARRTLVKLLGPIR